jgi:MYXO-CTERM domain-containing protein
MNKLKMITLATLMAVGSTWAVAQEPASDSSSMQNTNQSADDDDGHDWGWLGLLGLAGLMGLKRKDREDVVRTANRPI